ncbi:hypothetical protein I4U23_026955 [Adineta vaga]|nr:hypothetical protein I4U23_026955 [Adineta vaga]
MAIVQEERRRMKCVNYAVLAVCALFESGQPLTFDTCRAVLNLLKSQYCISELDVDVTIEIAKLKRDVNGPSGPQDPIFSNVNVMANVLCHVSAYNY